jgi:methanogenic corrinoid protein MtbC1
MNEPLLTRYLQPLLAGRRAECFDLIRLALAEGRAAESIMRDVLWPAMAQVERLYRDDRINIAAENMACRINRTVADQLQAHLPVGAPRGKRVLVTCADEPREELGAQMVADLFQSDGWDVAFVGGGVPYDEMVGVVGQVRPDVMLVFGTEPEGVPLTRRMIEMIRDMNVCPTMNILVSGGVYNRADGLWHEVGADVFAETARDVITTANALTPRQGGRPRVGLVKQRRRKRKVAVATT